MPAWADDDGDCQDTRAEVLISESDGPITLSSDTCTVVVGRWLDPYTGQTFTAPYDVDIDHLVALADAHRSGGSAWPASRKHAYANDMGHHETLIAVDDATNASKSDRSPDQWLPPAAGYRCQYSIDWIAVKTTWTLTVTAAERLTLQQLLAAC